MITAKLIGVTVPKNIEGIATAEELVAYAARVSNPGNQHNTQTAPKLLKYLMKNKHWSPFEMVSIVMEVNTTRDIAHQLVRHRSMAFQEFSQRYANVKEMGFTLSEARLQDAKNRQASIETDDVELQKEWEARQKAVIALATETYDWAIGKGIAKEVARKPLPEGLTNSRLYVSGTLRSWVHYCQLRAEMGTQKEHRIIAEAAIVELAKEFPSIIELIKDTDGSTQNQ